MPRQSGESRQTIHTEGSGDSIHRRTIHVAAAASMRPTTQVMAEYRRQAATKKVSGADRDEQRALEDLRAAEAKLEALGTKTDEFNAVGD